MTAIKKRTARSWKLGLLGKDMAEMRLRKGKAAEAKARQRDQRRESP